MQSWQGIQRGNGPHWVFRVLRAPASHRARGASSTCEGPGHTLTLSWLLRAPWCSRALERVAEFEIKNDKQIQLVPVFFFFERFFAGVERGAHPLLPVSAKSLTAFPEVSSSPLCPHWPPHSSPSRPPRSLARRVTWLLCRKAMGQTHSPQHRPCSASGRAFQEDQPHPQPRAWQAGVSWDEGT